MTVPVVWYGNKPGILNRGYWDQAVLEAILDGSLWPPVGRVAFSHHADIEPGMEGAVVVVPARWFAQDVVALNKALSHLEWAFLILTGDEEGEFPHDHLRHRNLVVWVQTAHPGRHPNTGAQGRTRWRWLGDGWPPGTREILRAQGDIQPSTPWWFCGQLNNAAREQCVNALIARRQTHNDGVIKVTRVFGDRRVLSQEQFLSNLSEAKVAPCPAGTYSPDTFRVFEALEAGRVPIVDRVAPSTPWEETYWETLFGGDPPFPVISNWTSDFGPSLERVLGDWPQVGTRCSAWWQDQKRTMAVDFYDDLGWVANLPAVPSVDDQITVLVSTSPIATHPDPGILAQTITSVRERLPHSEILVMCDGVRSEQQHRKRDYHEFLRRLCWLTNHEWPGVLPVIYDEWLHQAEMTRRTLPKVRTPFVLFVEHDTPLVNDIEWSLLAAALESGEANLIRLHHESRILEPHKHLMLDDSPRYVAGCRVMGTVQWSQRPHLATTDFYRRILNDYFGREARTMIEDVMYGVVLTHHHHQRMAGWERFRTFIYAPEDPLTIQRSTHTDGRAGESKYGMLWRYDTVEPPLGAPAPRRDEPALTEAPTLPCPCVREG